MALEGQSEVRLSYMQNNFSVTFNIQNYALADQVEYAYMLKGLENSWYTVTDPNNVTFRNIPPGNYCFQVKTRIRNQEWADEIASLDIRIDPPVWLTWWAKLFYILVLGFRFSELQYLINQVQQPDGALMDNRYFL